MTAQLPSDYRERVYAGVLGKIIGVYLGRPFEGWHYNRIMEHLGEVDYYVHDKLDVPLIVTDDDISGTFTFLRALNDYDHSRDLTPAQIGQTWLNYLIEERTVLWWGGVGNSTEHTAYMRLKHGIEAPMSGSIAMNGKVVAEQIGSQIFIDGWAMVAPGDPEFAADLAKRAGSVSHDGEAIYGAQVLAAMEAQAFVESDINKLIDTAIALIPNDSVIYTMIQDIREWHAATPDDWRATRELIEANYGYDKYGGNCHMVPNHGLIIHSLLHGDDDFQKSLMIVNTCGWDTDCNSGNVGCLLGIKNGLAGIDNSPVDWRGPVADRMYLPTADGGRSISDAVQETYRIEAVARELHGETVRVLHPKGNSQFHFELPGSVQGFEAETENVRVENVQAHSAPGRRSLAIHCEGLDATTPAQVASPTFIPSKEVADYFSNRGYALHASPRLYPGQQIQAELESGLDNTFPIKANLYAKVYDGNDEIYIVRGEQVTLGTGDRHRFMWKISDDELEGGPIASIGVEVYAGEGAPEESANASVYLDYLTWYGAPDVTFKRTSKNRDPNATVDRRSFQNAMWRWAWVNGIDQYHPYWPEPFRLVHNEGTGLLIQGTREWTDYQVSSSIYIHLVESGGIAARVQGMRRYYGLLLCRDEQQRTNKARLVKALDGTTVLAEAEFDWVLGGTYDFNLKVEGNRLVGSIDGQELFDVEDNDHPLTGGAIALVCEEGRMMADEVTVKPVA
ncbi:MAG: ADP-ribosylglycohydrolase family protein [Chloroflexota bacterium]